MSSLTISVTNQIVEPLKEILCKEFNAVNWRSEGLYTCLDLPGESGFRFKSKVMNILARLIFNQLSYLWLKKILQLNYGYFDREEHQEILVYACKLLTSCPRSLYHSVYRALADHLITNNQINLEGFVRFRTKDYWHFLCKTVDSAVDAYLIHREYQEFIKLLRYFVELQEPKVEMVNVIIGNSDRFKILDQDCNLIEMDYLEGIILEIGHNELDFEDLLISALISIAPAKIILHICQASSRAGQTILSIFGKNRVLFCDDCVICRNFCKWKKGK